MKITSEDVYKFIIDRQHQAAQTQCLSNDVVSAMTMPYIGLLFVTMGLIRVAEAIENAQKKTT